jgi:hypothetical protein
MTTRKPSTSERIARAFNAGTPIDRAVTKAVHRAVAPQSSPAKTRVSPPPRGARR